MFMLNTYGRTRGRLSTLPDANPPSPAANHRVLAPKRDVNV